MSDSPNPTRRTVLAAGAATLAASSAAFSKTEEVRGALSKLGPKSTAAPGPGEFAGGKVDFTETGVQGPENFDTFGCDVFRENPNTPDWTTANAYFERKVFLDGELTMPDGRKIRRWGFEDPLKAPGKRLLPSPLVRVQAGDLVHVKLDARSSSHTIHHHGIQPTTFNDGVGHVSFEVTGNYIYQWQPEHAGTFFYHCHKNTTLHFKMGMYGPLIVDPRPNAEGKVLAYEPPYREGQVPVYDVEQFWVLDDIDPRWQDLNHDAGLCGEDVGLNIFKPKYFLITGTPTQPNVPTNAQKVVASPGQKILIRLLNAAYSVAQVKIEGLASHIIMTDARALNQPWNEWVSVPAGTPIFLGTAQRRTLLIDTGSAANTGKRGTFRVSFEFQDWITRRVHNASDTRYEGRAFTTITV
jgi:FtsP/CotA-like multicopper oxidase with cupredoxin domain